MILKAKLLAPGLPHHMVARAELSDWVLGSLGYRLVLVCAARGSGKTTLLASAYHSLSGQSDHRVSWLSLDAAGSNPQTLWAYLASAFEDMGIPAYTTLFWPVPPLASLKAPPEEAPPAAPPATPPPAAAPPADDWAAEDSQQRIRLSNLLFEHVARAEARPQACPQAHAEPRPQAHPQSRPQAPAEAPGKAPEGAPAPAPARKHIVFIDGLEKLGVATLKQLLGFACEMTPAGFCFIAASEYLPKPLSWFGLLDSVRILPEDALGVTCEQIAALLRQLGVPTEGNKEAEALRDACDGWIAGILLRVKEGASLAASEAQAQVKAENYFQKWVMEAISNELCSFLVESSSLEMLHAPLCDYALGRQDSQACIEELLERNIFIREQPGSPGWYSLQKQLRAFLQQRALSLHVDYTNEINFRAYEWFERGGFECQAARHLLMAVDTKLLHSFTAPAIRSLDESQSLREWALARTTDRLGDNPVFSLLSSVAYLTVGDPSAALRWLAKFSEQTEAGHEDINSQGAQVVIDSIKTKASSLAGEHVQAIKAIQMLLSSHGSALSPAQECMSACTLGESYERTGQFMFAQENYLRGEAIGEMTGFTFGRFMSSLLYASEQMLLGRVNQAAELCYQALRACPQDLPVYGGFYRLLADIQIERGELADASVSLQRAFKRLSFVRNIDLYLEACITKARHLAAGGELEEAYELLLQNARKAAHRAVARGICAMNDLTLAKLALHRGCIDEARLLSHKTRCSSPPADVVVAANLDLLDALLAHEDGRSEDALLLLNKTLEESEKHSLAFIHMEAQLASILPSISAGRRTQAAVSLSDALAFGKQTGSIRCFVAYRAQIRPLLHDLAQTQKMAPNIQGFARRLLLAFDARDLADKRRLSKDIEPDNPILGLLTPREREVIKLVANGFSRKEISEALCVSPNTTKAHMGSIFTKLGVNSRAELIAMLS